MSLFDRLKRLNPIAAVDREVAERVEATTQAAVRSGLAELAVVSPPLGDLLAGDPVELQATVTVRLQLKR